MRLSAFFFGEPGGPHDKAANSIFKNHGGTHVGSGTMLVGAGAGERDVQYDIPDDRAEACKGALKKAGFRLEPTAEHTPPGAPHISTKSTELDSH